MDDDDYYYTYHESEKSSLLIQSFIRIFYAARVYKNTIYFAFHPTIVSSQKSLIEGILRKPVFSMEYLSEVILLSFYHHPHSSVISFSFAYFFH